jgi:hypothetical protein
MTIYAVTYYDGLRVGGMPFQCPMFSRQCFEEKKALGYPSALISREQGGKPVLIDSYNYEALETAVALTKKIQVGNPIKREFDTPLEVRDAEIKINY